MGWRIGSEVAGLAPIASFTRTVWILIEDSSRRVLRMELYCLHRSFHSFLSVDSL